MAQIMDSDDCAVDMSALTENLNLEDSPGDFKAHHLETIVEASPYSLSAQSSEASSASPGAVPTGKWTTGSWRLQTAQLDDRELAMTRMWYKSTVGKKIPAPAQSYPTYLRNPPALHFGETECSAKRQLIAQKAKSTQLVAKRADKMTESAQPKMNKATSLRNSFIRRQPVMSTYFESHFHRFQKPPFKSGIRCEL